MRLLSILLLCTACSVSSSTNSTPTNSIQDVESTAESQPISASALGPQAFDLEDAYFYSQDPMTPKARDPLELDKVAVTISSAPGTLRTRMDVVIRNPSKQQKQARIRVPIPTNAAVTEAVLFVGDKPMRGAFLEANRAERVYKSYTQRRRDPLLAVWSGPSWVDLRIFPVEGEQTRRFQLEWVEPHMAGNETHRLPVLAHRGKVVGSPSSAVVDGQALMATKGVIALAPPEAPLVSVKRPGGAFGYVLAPGLRPSETNIVLVAETSRHMTLALRAQQRRDIESVLLALPADARVSLLSADWLTKQLAVNQSPQQMLAALPALDDIISAGSLDISNTVNDATTLAEMAGAHTVLFLGQGQHDFRPKAFIESARHLRDAEVSLFVIAPKDASREIEAMASHSNGRVLFANDPLLALTLRGHGTPPEVPGVEGWALLDSAQARPMWMGHFVGAKPAQASLGSVADLDALWTRSQVHGMGSKVAQSETSSVLTPSTSILVLESDKEYQRWGIPVPSAISEDNTPPRQLAVQSNQGASRRSREETIRRAEAIEAARNAGVYGILGSKTGGFAQTTGQFSSGIDDRDIYGGLLGNEVGEMQGGWGYGIRGTGAGAGGTTGWGTIGTGNYGIIGHGSGGGGNANVAVLRGGKASVTGNLDKNIIRRYVRRKWARMRHCYEKELLVKPNLRGAVYVSFQINPTGTVMGVHAAGIGNRRVESCVAAAIKSIQFPKPRGGGYVNVRYPFTFDSGRASQTQVKSPLAKALAAFETSKKGAGAHAASQELGVDFKSGPTLAWWILTKSEKKDALPAEGMLLAAELLHEAGDDWNSRRVFSELRWRMSSEYSEKLRALGFASDASRLAAHWL